MNAPSESPRTWSPEARQFFGKQFTDAVDEGCAIFAPYTCEQIAQDSSLAIELQRRTSALQNRAIEIAVQAFIKYLFLIGNDKIRAKREPTAAFEKLDQLIASAYPEWLAGTYSQNIFLNLIMGAMRTNAMARIVKNRYRNNKPGRHEYPLYEELGLEWDYRRIHELQRRDPVLASAAYGSYFQFLGVEKFFQSAGINSREDERQVSTTERRNLNNAIAQVISENHKFGVPLCMAETEHLAKEKVHVQFDDIDVHTPENALYSAHVILYNDTDGQLMRQEPNLLGMTRGVLDANLFHSKHSLINDSVGFFIARDGGEIHGTSAHPQALQYFLGNAKYELLRTHLLLRLAELTCRAEDLRRALQGIIELPPLVPYVPRGPRTGEGSPRQGKLLPLRYFPRSALQQSDSLESGPTRTIKLHKVEYHIRILPPGNYPSRRALELASDHDMALRIISDNGVIRYETFVRKHERGQPNALSPQNTELAVQAQSRLELISVVNRVVGEETHRE